MPRGIKPRSLGPIDGSWSSTAAATLGVPFEIRFKTEASTSTYDWLNDSGRNVLVTQCYGYMTGAGASSDTVKAGRVAAAAGSTSGDITDTKDVSALGDTDYFDLGEIDDAYNNVYPGDTIRITTASDALCNVFVHGFWKE